MSAVKFPKTIKDIYSLPVISASSDLFLLRGAITDLLPELLPRAVGSFDAIEIRTHAIYQRKEKVWALRSVWYLGEPVMVVQNGGAFGDEFGKRMITNPERFQRMLAYIVSNSPAYLTETDVYDEQDSPSDLTDFFGVKLTPKLQLVEK